MFAPGWTNEILEEGRAALGRLGASIDAADPGRVVLPRSRLLCAGLARLATEVGAALGAGARAVEIADLAASISLLTKIDDEVIDARAFHGGSATDRDELRARTAAFLAPTLASMREATPATSEPRCGLAATIGARVRDLAGSADRADALLDLLASGWSTQVDAVVTLTGDPRAADLDEVNRVTRRISGDWLAIVAACGALPREAARPLTADEIEAIRDCGLFIQRTDSLCDLEKDQREGLTSTWAACRAARASSADQPCLEVLFEAIRSGAIDDEAIPPRAEVERIATRLAGLGHAASLLEWIRKMLLARYLAHPLTQPDRRAIVRSSLTVAEVSCSAR
ncbi:MAG: hypothetical protein JNL21_27805 [Myxococcales bacterium]|nr:hypothetical protein [Myxococcales bacterium]